MVGRASKAFEYDATLPHGQMAEDADLPTQTPAMLYPHLSAILGLLLQSIRSSMVIMYLINVHGCLKWKCYIASNQGT